MTTSLSCPVLQRTFRNHLTNTLHSLESHKPHAANYRSLVICFARIPASRAKQTSRARGGTRRRVTQDCFSRDLNRTAGFSSNLASYCTTVVSAKQALPSWVPPHLEELNPAHGAPVASLQQGSLAGLPPAHVSLNLYPLLPATYTSPPHRRWARASWRGCKVKCPQSCHPPVSF